MVIGKREQQRREERYRALRDMRQAAVDLVKLADIAIEWEVYNSPRSVLLTVNCFGRNDEFYKSFQWAAEHYNRLITEHQLAKDEKA